MWKYDWSKNTVTKAVSKSRSYAQTLRKIDPNMVPHHGNYNTLKRKIKKYRVSTEHFDHKPPKSKRGTGGGVKIPLKDILVQNSTYAPSHLRKRLINEGVFDQKCSQCDITKWQGKPAPLQLDHINGVNDDNRLENLRFLCPNCHAQTPTYAGRNQKTKPKNTCIDCTREIHRQSTRCTICYNQSLQTTSSGKKEYKKTGSCNQCNSPCDSYANLCKDCYDPAVNLGGYGPRPDQRIFDPTPEKLEKLVWAMPATKVGEHFGVSSNAIKKRCKKYGIETPGRGYWQKKRAGKLD